MIFRQKKDLFEYDGGLYNHKDLTDKIVNGYSITVENQEGHNITKEFLMKAAFRNKDFLWNYVEYFFTNDELTDIIEIGGSKKAIDRARRGLDD